MSPVNFKVWLATVVYVLLVMVSLTSGRHQVVLPVNDASALIRQRASQQLKAQGFTPVTPPKRFGVFWMRDVATFQQPGCTLPTWVFAADASVNLPQYFRSAMGSAYTPTYVYYGSQGDPPVSLVRWLHRYVRQVGARLGMTEPPLTAYLLVEHPLDCSPLPDLRPVFLTNEA